MYALFTDETNMPADVRAEFFAYGGLIVPSGNLAAMHQGIEEIRANAGYRAGDELKFETNARPNHVSIEAARLAKSQTINLCIQLNCRFIVYVILHDICRNTPQDNLVRWGADHVIGKFNYFLRQRDEHGIVAVDRFPSAAEYRLLTDKFNHGLTLPDGEQVSLDRILLFTSTCMNASHACSAMDIVLGSFRYCINQPRNVDAAREMMHNITRLIWCTRDAENIYALERGLIFRPREVRVDAYRSKYDELLAHINRLIAENN